MQNNVQICKSVHLSSGKISDFLKRMFPKDNTEISTHLILYVHKMGDIYTAGISIIECNFCMFKPSVNYVDLVW